MQRRLPSSSSSSIHSSSSSNAPFWRHPPPSAPHPSAVALDPPSFPWQDHTTGQWPPVTTSYVPYDPSDDYVSPVSTGSFAEDYLHPSIPPGSFASAAAADRHRSASAHPLPAHDKPRFDPASWDNDLYRFDPDAPQHSDPSPAPPSPHVKQEEIVADDFVFEMNVNGAGPVIGGNCAGHHATMTEVPLRATNASKRQRAMMGSFRLDPFAMHNGQHGAAVKTGCLDLVGPLTEPPLIFEFQLDLPWLAKADLVQDADEETGAAPTHTQSARHHLDVSPSPSPSLGSEPAGTLSYTLDDQEQREDALHRWSSPPGPYAMPAPQIPDTEAFEPIMTPAQSLWQMSYQPERDGSSYSLSPPTSLHSAEHSSPYLPPLKPLRPTYTEKSTYSHSTNTHTRLLPVAVAAPRTTHNFAGESYPDYSDEYADHQWSRKTVSLSAMFYSPSKLYGSRP